MKSRARSGSWRPKAWSTWIGVPVISSSGRMATRRPAARSSATAKRGSCADAGAFEGGVVERQPVIGVERALEGDSRAVGEGDRVGAPGRDETQAGVRAQLGERARRAVAFEISRRGHEKEARLPERAADEAGILEGAHPHRDVIAFADEIDMMVGDAELEADARVPHG